MPYAVLFSTVPFRVQCCIECLLRIFVLYRPNVTPGTKRGVGACVRPARQSRDCLRGRPLRAPPLFVAVRSAAGSVQPTVARGASCVQLVRSARHLAVTSLRSCARLRLRGYPPLRFGAFTFGCTFTLRCIIRSPIRAVRLRMEYHPSPSITVSTAPYASRRTCALRSPVALRFTPLRY